MSRRYSSHKPLIMRHDDRLSLSFDQQRVQSEMRLDAPDELVLGYTRTMMGFVLFNPRPQRLAMIGLGGGSLLKYCHARLPDTHLTVVEVDPQVIALRQRFFIPDDDEQLQVQCADGAEFVRTASGYDVLLVDAFTDLGQPASLCTQGFYNDCYQCLNQQGMLVVNLSDLELGFAAPLARLRHSFEHVQAIAAEDSTNQIVFASKVRPEPLQQQAWLQFETHPALNLYRTLQALQGTQG